MLQPCAHTRTRRTAHHCQPQLEAQRASWGKWATATCGQHIPPRPPTPQHLVELGLSDGAGGLLLLAVLVGTLQGEQWPCWLTHPVTRRCRKVNGERRQTGHGEDSRCPLHYTTALHKGAEVVFPCCSAGAVCPPKAGVCVCAVSRKWGEGGMDTHAITASHDTRAVRAAETGASAT
jgi:hypothetical protein